MVAIGSPNSEVEKIEVNATGSVPITCLPPVCHMARAYSTVPVPSVAMNESICAISTSMPFTSPSSAPSASTTSTATGQSKPYTVCRLMARMCHITMP